MARKYRRKSNGQFAGGGGTSVSSKGGGARPKAAAGKKKTNSIVAANRMAKNAKAKRANPSGQIKVKAKSSKRQKVIMFAAKNPRLVLGVAAIAAANMPMGSTGTSGISKATKAMAQAAKYATDTASDKKGIGGRPGAGLKASKRNVRGAYKIRSK